MDRAGQPARPVRPSPASEVGDLWHWQRQQLLVHACQPGTEVAPSRHRPITRTIFTSRHHLTADATAQFPVFLVADWSRSLARGSDPRLLFNQQSSIRQCRLVPGASASSHGRLESTARRSHWSTNNQGHLHGLNREGMGFCNQKDRRTSSVQAPERMGTYAVSRLD